MAHVALHTHTISLDLVAVVTKLVQMWALVVGTSSTTPPRSDSTKSLILV